MNYYIKTTNENKRDKFEFISFGNRPEITFKYLLNFATNKQNPEDYFNWADLSYATKFDKLGAEFVLSSHWLNSAFNFIILTEDEVIIESIIK